MPRFSAPLSCAALVLCAAFWNAPQAASQEPKLHPRLAVNSAAQQGALPLHLKLALLPGASAPEVFGDRLILSAKGPYRFVGAAFAHEEFRVVHPFALNGKGVFVLAYPIPLKYEGELAYRLIVDGAWITDPLNPRMIRDPRTALDLSAVEVPYISDLRPGSYSLVARDGRSARFVFRAPASERVSVCGDFNNWDPFIHELSETSPGLYELTLPLAPGRHHYAFVWRGEFVADPLNPERVVDQAGRTVSTILVP